MTRACAIATPHATATEVAADVVGAGGNAVDAAVAASVALSVVYPHNTTLGGDLVALVRTPDGRIRCVNASGPAARRTDPDAVRERYGGVMPTTGVHTITVPGAVAGLGAVHGPSGALPWRDVVAPAVGLARGGVEVAPSLGRALAKHTAGIEADEGMAAVFAPAGDVLQTGATLVQDALAGSLEQLADHGPHRFHAGDVGATLAAGLQRLGSDLTHEDLSTFTPEEVEPLHLHHRGRRVWTSPLNTQGYQLLQLLAAVDALPPGTDVRGTQAHVLAAMWTQANKDRRGILADPRRSHVDVDALLDPRRLLEAAAVPVRAGTPTDLPQPGGDTVAVVTADSSGHAVCLIQSVFHSFGALVLEPTTGILLHNRGAFFDLEPASPNCLAGGKRPGHTLMPVMVTDGDRLEWVLGTMGGKAQPQIHHQVLTALLDGVDPEDAVRAPRWVVGGLGAGAPEEQILVEADVPDEVVDSLRRGGHPLVTEPPLSEKVGHAQVVGPTPDGFRGASDPRSDGSAVVVGSDC